MSDIGNKWLSNPFKNLSVQCGHFCIFLRKPNLLETKSDSERISDSSVWPNRNRVSVMKSCEIWQQMKKKRSERSVKLKLL